MYKRIIPVLASLALLVGAATPTQAADVGGYFKDRGNDVLDLFRLRAGFPEHGRGLGVKARATSLVQLGYVDFEGSYAGLDRRGLGVVDEKRREAGLSLAYGSYNEMVATSGNHYLRADTNWSALEDRRILRNLPHWDDGRRRPLSLGAELALPIGAVDLGLYPEEAVDLLFGVFTIDIFNDDVASDVEIPNGMATTAPEPVADAPFADKRAKHAEYQAALALRALEEAGQSPEAEAPLLEDTGVVGEPTSFRYAPTEQPETITEAEADSTMQALEEIEGLKAAIEETGRLPKAPAPAEKETGEQ